MTSASTGKYNIQVWKKGIPVPVNIQCHHIIELILQSDSTGPGEKWRSSSFEPPVPHQRRALIARRNIDFGYVAPTYRTRKSL